MELKDDNKLDKKSGSILALKSTPGTSTVEMLSNDRNKKKLRGGRLSLPVSRDP